MGRRPVPLELKPTIRSIRLSPRLADFSYQLAKHCEISEYALLGRIVERVLTSYQVHIAYSTTPLSSSACYTWSKGATSSTLSLLLGQLKP